MQVKIVGIVCRFVANQSIAADFLEEGEGSSRDEARKICLEKTDSHLRYFVNLGGGILIPEERFGDVPNNLPVGRQLLVVERWNSSLHAVTQRYYLAVKPGKYKIAGEEIEVFEHTPGRISTGMVFQYPMPPDVTEYLDGIWSACVTLD